MKITKCCTLNAITSYIGFLIYYMAIFTKNKRIFMPLVTPLLFASIIFYFSYHLISGDKGMLALMQLSQKVDDARLEFDSVELDRVKLAHKVSMLYPHSLDADLLDEQSRRILGVAKKGEIIYLYPNNH